MTSCDDLKRIRTDQIAACVEEIRGMLRIGHYIGSIVVGLREKGYAEGCIQEARKQVEAEQ